jgi:hypothetical protein
MRRCVARRLCNGVRPPHRQGFFPRHWLAGQVAECEVNSRGLGADAVAVHDRLDVIILDLDIGANLRHTRILHVPRMVRVLSTKEWTAGTMGGVNLYRVEAIARRAPEAAQIGTELQPDVAGGCPNVPFCGSGPGDP